MINLNLMRRGVPHGRASRGVSLVELSVMIVVIGILSLVIFSSMTLQQTAIEKSALRRAAIAACQSHIDRTLATQYSALNAIRNDPNQNRWDDVVDGVTYTSVRVITPRTHLNGQQYFEIRITTTYPTMVWGNPVVMDTIVSQTEG